MAFTSAEVEMFGETKLSPHQHGKTSILTGSCKTFFLRTMASDKWYLLFTTVKCDHKTHNHITFSNKIMRHNFMNSNCVVNLKTFVELFSLRIGKLTACLKCVALNLAKLLLHMHCMWCPLLVLLKSHTYRTRFARLLQ